MNKLYSIAFFSLVMSCVAVFSYGFFFLEPLSGDLTRVGGYSETNFGWMDPQKEGEDKIVKGTDPSNQLEAYDVIILGDSFSHYSKSSGSSWQVFFEQRSKLSTITYNSRKVTTKDILNSTIVQQQPPKYFIYEFVERSIYKITRTSNSTDHCGSAIVERINEVEHPARNFGWTPLNDFKPIYRKRGNPPLEDLGSFFKQRILERSKVTKLALTRHDLFSNKKPNEILIFNRDLKKFQFDDEYYSQLTCYLLSIQAQFLKRGVLTVFLMAPDKSTVYADYLPSGFLPARNFFEIIDHPKLNLLRLDIEMKSATEKGVIDLYLPNDTHWGWRGSDLAASTLVEWLAGEH